MPIRISPTISTPLTSLDGYFQLLRDSKEQKERERYLKVIQERIVSLKEMLEELFTYTKLKNETYELKLEPLYLNRILTETAFSYYDVWVERGMEPEIDLPRSSCRSKETKRGFAGRSRILSKMVSIMERGR